MTYRPLLSFVIVARNAGLYLPNAFADFLAQDFPCDQIEFLFVDGQSDDDSLQKAEEFKSAHPSIDFTILRNPNRILASGWNVALRRVKGDIILRIDAHARIPTQFIRNNVKTILAGHDIVGGSVISQLPQNTFPRLIALAERSKFGGGAADFRNRGEARHVDTLAYAAYKREVFGIVGGYHELLVRTEDNEIHARMKAADYKFWLTPDIHSERTARASLFGLLKQMFGNGYWIALTLPVAPSAFGVRHFVPFIFLMTSLIGISLLSVTPIPLLCLTAAYLLVAILFTIRSLSKQTIIIKLLSPLLPLIFFLMHIAYGFGTFCGIVHLPVALPALLKYKPPYPISPTERVKQSGR